MSETTRRDFVKGAALAGVALSSPKLIKASSPAAASIQNTNTPEAPTSSSPPVVELSWLGSKPPALATGVSWGVPWPKGAVTPRTRFSLRAQGRDFPLQMWPLAYWPDGSLKWSGCASVVPAGFTGKFNLSSGSTEETGTVSVRNVGNAIVVDTGALRCTMPSGGGKDLVESMSVGGHAVVGTGQLVCILQNGPEGAPEETHPREKFVSMVKKVTVEQTGPVRAVVKFEGVHQGLTSGREWLPFSVRLYFYSGQTAVRMVHTMLFDGDQEKDFIHGLGISFSVPFREEIQNRHVRFSGSGDGLWSEPIQSLAGRGGPKRIVADVSGKDVYPAQLEGKRVPNRAQMNAQGIDMVDHFAVWSDFKLTQLDHTGFSIRKRTNPQSTWLFSNAGERSSGFVFVGDVSGGLGLSVKNFWQSHPAELHVQHAAEQAAELTAWVWSPEAGPMDLRHYDTHAHGLEETYEDVQQGNSTPYGIGRTSELTLWPTADVPTKAACADMAQAGTMLPLLVSTPQYYHDVRACGFWSVRDTSTPFKAAIEKNLEDTLALYLGQVDQRHWYGFWNYGDVMHSYDRERHTWHYDMGGQAWDNSELAPDTWLWYTFLRTGRADVFRMAEAMTRHTGEVDSYHFGPMAGLGTRHGVSHWGDGAKEARIGQAAFRRPFYYLTTDERTGDIMRGALQAVDSVSRYDPMRLADPPRPGDPPFPVRVRMGPDWLALCGNWMTEWERTGNTQYRDKIVAGMKSIEAMPYGFRTGRNLVVGFNAATSRLTPRDNTRGMYNLATIMGGAELMFELNMSIDDEAWKKVWAEFCADSAASISAGKLQAYAYFVTKDPALAQSATDSLRSIHRLAGTRVVPPESLAVMDDGTDTNGSSQSSLNAIAVLEFCADKLPTSAPPPNDMPGSGARRPAGEGQ